VIFNEKNEKIGYKIREAESKKVPYMIVIGEKEKELGNISIREHKKGDIGKFELKEFIENLKLKISQKVI
jgi:threonyl-tRNA synthetase